MNIANNNLSYRYTCFCCGSHEYFYSPVLNKKLINEWELYPEEIEYVNKQQGIKCINCKCNLRANAIAKAILREYNFSGSLKDFVTSNANLNLAVLEINKANHLGQFLRSIPNYRLIEFPAFDMQALAIDNNSYDLIIHSDTLEHIPNPIKALKECYRVLRECGKCIFTVPIIVNRLSRSRISLPPSYHGTSETVRSDYLVHTEFGANIWCDVLQSGFDNCSLISIEYPVAQAIVASKYFQ